MKNELVKTNNTEIIERKLPDGCVIILKDIVDIINEGRGVSKGDKGFIEHNKAMKIVDDLSKEDSFGCVEKFSTHIKMPNGGTKEVITYALTKKQAIAVGARLDNTMLMKVIDRLEELEKANRQLNIPSYQIEDPIERAKRWIEEQKEKIALEQKIERDRPKVEFATQIENAANSILIGNYAKMLSKENGIKIGQNRLFKWLRDNGYLIKNGRRKNMPKQEFIENGYFEVKTSTVVVGTKVKEYNTTLITGRGQIALANKIIAYFKGETDGK